MSYPVYTMRFPRRYVFGENAMAQCAENLAHLGKKFLFLMGCGPIAEGVTATIKKSFEEKVEDKSAYELLFQDVEGLVPTGPRVQEIAARVKADGIDVVIGVGGGRALDMARGQAHHSDSKVALFPTSAATNAAGTRIQVIFADESAKEILFYLSNDMTELVLLDTALVVKAPARVLAAGMGDAFAGGYEAITSAQRYNNYVETDSTFGWAALNDGLSVFYEKGLAAMAACKAGFVTSAFNQVVESIVFSSGVFTSNLRGGMSLPHLIGDTVLIHLETELHRFMHGEIVGYAVLPLMVEFNFPIEEMYRYADFIAQLGMPVNFEQLGIAGTPKEEMLKWCDTAHDSIIQKLTRNTYTSEEIYGYMVTADQIISDYLASK